MPSRSVIAVTLPGRALRSGSCPAELRRTLSSDRPKAVVLLPLAQELCAPEPAPELGRVRGFDLGSLRLDRAGRPYGIGCPAGNRCLADLGIEHATDWTAVADPAVVPKLSLEDLSSGRLPSDVLKGRIVVLGIAGEAEGNATAGGVRRARE